MLTRRNGNLSLRVPVTFTASFCPIFGIIPPLNLMNAARSLCAAAAAAHADKGPCRGCAADVQKH